MSTVTLNDGRAMPRIGLGVFQSPDGEVTRAAVLAALEAGYRLIDTAAIYRNEASVGDALQDGGVPREEIFLTTKLWNSDHGYDATLRACRASMERLGVDYLDLYLVHWPVAGLRRDTWRAMETLRDDGLVRSIGVSNYLVRHLHELLAHCRVRPVVNQIELSPYNFRYREAVVELCRDNDIAIECYSPLTKGLRLSHPPLVQLADEVGKTPAQVLIRWALDKGFIVIPKSSRPSRIRENLAARDFSLNAAQVERLDALNEDLVTGWDPTDAP